MSQNFARLLSDNDLVRHFLNDVLNFDHSEYENIVERIVDGELGAVKSTKESQTISSTKNRSSKYLDDITRWQLRKQIIEELYNLKRLEKDDEIALANGGAMPNSNLKSDKQAFIIIGLPASGKSGVAAGIAEDFGAVILDSDFAKRKLPEYPNHLYGASVVHVESSQITFGFRDNPNKVKSLYEKCLENDHNVVIPKIGDSYEDVIKLAKALIENNGYDVHLISVQLFKRDATIRAIKRYNSTKRYVPLGLIFDGYGNDPYLAYYYIRCKHSDLFKSIGCVSNDVPENHNPICIDSLGSSPILKYK